MWVFAVFYAAFCRLTKLAWTFKDTDTEKWRAIIWTFQTSALIVFYFFITSRLQLLICIQSGAVFASVVATQRAMIMTSTRFVRLRSRLLAPPLLPLPSSTPSVAAATPGNISPLVAHAFLGDAILAEERSTRDLKQRWQQQQQQQRYWQRPEGWMNRESIE